MKLAHPPEKYRRGSHKKPQQPVLEKGAVALYRILYTFNLHKAHRISAISLRELNPFKQLGCLLAHAHLRWLLLAVFLYYLPFASMGQT